MSHHLDSPTARKDVRLNTTDLYAFRGETGTVLIVNVCHSLGGGKPDVGYHPEGMYEFKVDLDGDSVEDLTYRFLFSARRGDGAQHFTLHRIDGEAASDPFAAGKLIAEGDTDVEVTSTDGVRVWAGKAGDPFWIDPTILHAVGHAVQDGTTAQLGDWTPAQAVNVFAEQSVYAIVIEVPDETLTGHGGATNQVGVWAVASLRTDAGGWRLINRIGFPMIGPLFTQFDEQLGEQVNLGRPLDDASTYGPRLQNRIAGLVRAYGTASDPEVHAERFTRRFLPNILPYTVGSAAEFGFLGIDGRALTDNAADVMFTLAANTPITVGVGKESVTEPPSATFPYVPSAPAGN
ncbi:MAG: DUF4331 family protein [Mycetocola sp.]